MAARNTLTALRRTCAAVGWTALYRATNAPPGAPCRRDGGQEYADRPKEDACSRRVDRALSGHQRRHAPRPRPMAAPRTAATALREHEQPRRARRARGAAGLPGDAPARLQR